MEQLAEGDTVQVGHERGAELRTAAAAHGRADAGELQRVADALQVAPEDAHPDHPVSAQAVCLLEDPAQRGVAGFGDARLVVAVLPVVPGAVLAADPVAVEAVRAGVGAHPASAHRPAHAVDGGVPPLSRDPVHARAHHHPHRLEAGVLDGRHLGDREVAGPGGPALAQLLDALLRGERQPAPLEGRDAGQLALLGGGGGLVAHQRSSERTMRGVAISRSGSLRTAVPIAKNSMV